MPKLMMNRVTTANKRRTPAKPQRTLLLLLLRAAREVFPEPPHQQHNLQAPPSSARVSRQAKIERCRNGCLHRQRTPLRPVQRAKRPTKMQPPDPPRGPIRGAPLKKLRLLMRMAEGQQVVQTRVRHLVRGAHRVRVRVRMRMRVQVQVRVRCECAHTCTCKHTQTRTCIRKHAYTHATRTRTTSTAAGWRKKKRVRRAQCNP